MPMAPPPDLWTSDPNALAAVVAGTRQPPVERWNPPRCGDSGIRIARDGTWWHDGAPIARGEMVRLFASVLRREPDGGFALVTPAEHLTVEVEDAPFSAVECRAEGGRLIFRLSTGELVVAGPDHPLAIADRPYLRVRPGLDALISRSVFYELAELALAADPPGVTSEGAFFAFPAA